VYIEGDAQPKHRLPMTVKSAGTASNIVYLANEG